MNVSAPSLSTSDRITLRFTETNFYPGNSDIGITATLVELLMVEYKEGQKLFCVVAVDMRDDKGVVINWKAEKGAEDESQNLKDCLCLGHPDSYDPTCLHPEFPHLIVVGRADDNREMLFWVNCGSRWELVSAVSIWRSGCNLTKPLQQNNNAGVPLATLQKDSKSSGYILELNSSDNYDERVKERCKWIVFAHLLVYHKEWINVK